MTNDQNPTGSNNTAPQCAFPDWLKDTRNRLAAEAPPALAAKPRPPRNVPKWVPALLLVVACGLVWLTWRSSLPGSRPQGEVYGRVRDIFQKPVAGALVFLFADPAIETRTNLDGSFSLTGVPLGNQIVLIAQDNMGEEYRVCVQKAAATDMGELVFRVPPKSERLAPGGGAYWGKK